MPWALFCGVYTVAGEGCFASLPMFSSFLTMSQRSTEATRRSRRLLKSVTSSALALSAVAGSVLFSGGEGKAMTQCFAFDFDAVPPPTPPLPPPGLTPAAPGNCNDGDWTNSFISFSANGQAGVVELSDISVSPDQAQLDIDFDPVTPGDTNGEYKYSIMTQDHNIIQVGLASDPGAIGADYDIYKFIYSDSTFSSASLVEVLHIDETSAITLSNPMNYPKLWIHDTWSTATIGLDNIVNIYKTPGPLPILGAGAAFGFTRKLRGRIRASRGA